MFLRTYTYMNPYDKLEERIKRDLMECLRKKGINISKLNIDMGSDKMNVRILINDKKANFTNYF